MCFLKVVFSSSKKIKQILKGGGYFIINNT